MKPTYQNAEIIESASFEKFLETKSQALAVDPGALDFPD